MRGGLTIALALVALAPAAGAQVNLKNGNFYTTYTDLAVDSFAIERTFNSKDVGSTLFGFGWSFKYATRLVPLGDGGAVLRYFGGGAKTFFTPPFVDEPRIGDAIRRIVEGRRKGGWEVSPDSMAAVRVSLRNDLELRSTWWQRVADSGHVEPAQYPVGSRWTASGGSETLRRTASGYTVENSLNGTLEFDDAGRLLAVTEENGRTQIGYDARGRIASLRAPNGAEFRFTLDDRGFVQRIDGTARSGQTYQATYVVDERTDLRDMVDWMGERFRYTLDRAHNLTRVDFADGTSTSITYDPSSFYATKVTNRDGSSAEYEYYGGDDLYGTRVTRRAGTAVRDRSHYQWEIATTEDGRRYTARYLFERNDTLTETFYDASGARVKVRSRTPSGETITEYGKDGQPIRK